MIKRDLTTRMYPVKDNKVVIRRDWKTNSDKIKGAFSIARDLAVLAKKA